jgi:hypothetical protein
MGLMEFMIVSHLYIGLLLQEQEIRFKLFEDKVLRRLFGPKKKKVNSGTEETAEEIHNLRVSYIIIMKMK